MVISFVVCMLGAFVLSFLLDFFDIDLNFFGANEEESCSEDENVDVDVSILKGIFQKTPWKLM